MKTSEESDDFDFQKFKDNVYIFGGDDTCREWYLQSFARYSIGARAMLLDRYHGSREIDVEPGESDHSPDTFRTE